MTNYVIKRILAMFPTIIGVTIVVFLLLQLIPGTVVEQMLGIHSSDPVAQERLRAFFGLDLPVHVQYWNWLSDMLTGNMGVSWRTGQELLPRILLAFVVTGEMALAAVIVSFIIGVSLGIIAALRPYGIFDGVLRILSIAGVSIPVFFQGALLILIFSMLPIWSPPVTYHYPWESLSKNLQIMLLPALTLGIASSAVIMRMTRSSLLEILGQDFIRTARSKGLSERVVVFRHALKNVMINIITAIGLQFGQIIGGIVVIEVIYTLPGVGQLIYNGLIQRDFPLVVAGIMFITIVTLFVNTGVDIIYKVADPRIRYE